MFFSRFSGNYFYIVLDFQESTKIRKIVWATVAIILLSIEFTPPRWSFFYYKYCNFFIGIYKQSTLYCLCYVQQAKKMYKPLALWKKACYSDLEIDSHSFIYYIHTPGLWIKDNFPPERNIATRLLGR